MLQLLPLAVSLGSRELGVIIALVALLVGGIIAVAGMYFHHQQKKLLHDTARVALEKGQPIPSELFSELNSTGGGPARHGSARHDIRAGIILIAVGIGLYLFFAAMSAQSLRFVGAIPGLIGVALLLFGIGSALLGRKRTP